MKRPEVDRMRALLVEAITTLCRSGLQYNANLKVEGLIGITLDEADIILVNLNKTFGTRFDEISVLDKTPQDEMATNDGEYDDKSLTEPLSPRERSRQDKSKKRHLTSTPLRESKKSRQTPTKEYSDNESKSSPQVFTDRVDFSRSPESQSTGDRKTDSNTYDGVPSASSVESALTTTEKSVPDNNSSSQQDSASNQDSRLSNPGAQHEGPVVKIEIDSDPEIEEVKVEPAPSQSCSRVPPLPYQTQVSAADNSLHNTFPQDFPQTIPSLSASDLQGELFASQLPPEFTAATQSDSSAVPIGMFSNTLAQTQPIAGPSGLSISSVTGASYVQGDSTAARQGSLQQGSPGFKTKCSTLAQGALEMAQFSYPTSYPSSYRMCNNLDLQSKYDLLMKLDKGVSRKEIASEYGIGISTVGRLYQNREKIVALYNSNSVDKTARRVRTTTSTNVAADEHTTGTSTEGTSAHF